MGRAISVYGRLEFFYRVILEAADRAHPPKEVGGVLIRMALRIFAGRIFHDDVNRPAIPARKPVREIMGLGRANRELGRCHAIKLGT